MQTDSLTISSQTDLTTSQSHSIQQDSQYQAYVLDSLRIEKDHEIELERLQNAVPDAGMVTIFVPIIAIVSVFLFLWRASENKRKVRLTMIEKGMDPSLLEVPRDESSHKYGALRWGMLLLGAGLGLFIGFTLNELVIHEQHSMYMVVSCTLLFTGLGLVIYHQLASKLEKENKH
ncbi:MAG: hypothetical protein HYX66_02540 [Ignavibacteria bacterium]|nr:hypothetical protein [Ignavibacteria bacterium]